MRSLNPSSERFDLAYPNICTSPDCINPCAKRWKSAGKVFFLARSPEAPRTITERQPCSEGSSRSLDKELKLLRLDLGEDPPDMINRLVLFFLQQYTGGVDEGSRGRQTGAVATMEERLDVLYRG